MNHLSPILNHLKKNVSRDRNRFGDDKYDLDLTYITPNIIVWRNHIDDVAEMLKTYHEGNYKIWNLSERTYDYSKFDNQLMDFGFPDHHSPPLKTLFEIVLSMYEWLRDKAHVAAVHCMGGKGRTGTVICAYLLFVNRFASPDDAFAYFATKRSAIEKGVTQPSQKRYVRYFSEVIQSGIFPKPRVLQIHKIMLVSVPRLCKGKTGCNPVVRIYSQTTLPKTLVFSSSPKGQPANQADGAIVWNVDCLVVGDILIKGKHAGKHRSRRLFRFAFHTAFVNETYLELKPEDLDDWRIQTDKDKEKDSEKHKDRPPPPPRVDGDDDKNFSLILYFTEPQPKAVQSLFNGQPAQDEVLSAHYEGVLHKLFEAKKTMEPYKPESVEFTYNPMHRGDGVQFSASGLYEQPAPIAAPLPVVSSPSATPSPRPMSDNTNESTEEAKAMLRDYYEKQLGTVNASARERLAALKLKLREGGGGSHIGGGQPAGIRPGSADLADAPAKTSPRVPSASPRDASPPVSPVSASRRGAVTSPGRAGEPAQSKASLGIEGRRVTEPVPATPWVHTTAKIRDEIAADPPAAAATAPPLSPRGGPAPPIGPAPKLFQRNMSERVLGSRRVALSPPRQKLEAEAPRRRADTQALVTPVGRDLNPAVGKITLENGDVAEIDIDCILGPRSSVLAAVRTPAPERPVPQPRPLSPSAPAIPPSPAAAAPSPPSPPDLQRPLSPQFAPQSPPDRPPTQSPPRNDALPPPPATPPPAPPPAAGPSSFTSARPRKPGARAGRSTRGPTMFEPINVKPAASKDSTPVPQVPD